MTAPDLALIDTDPLTIEGDVLVLGVTKTEDGPRLESDAPELAAMSFRAARDYQAAS